MPLLWQNCGIKKSLLRLQGPCFRGIPYPECDSYVGVHAGTFEPKGSLANGDLRHKRIETHRLFDAIWKNGIFTRADAYRWIQDIFCLNDSQAHIRQFSEYRCDCLMNECRKVLTNHHVKVA